VVATWWPLADTRMTSNASHPRIVRSALPDVANA
jgi:hypothetical protein